MSNKTPSIITLSQFWDSHVTSRGLTALAWMKVLDFLNSKSWTRDPRSFEDLTLIKTLIIPLPENRCTSKDEFIRLMEIVKYFLSFRNELDENNQPQRKEDEYWKEKEDDEEDEANQVNQAKMRNKKNRLATTRLPINHLTLLIERFYKDMLKVFPNDQKYEHAKLEVLEQLIHHMDPNEKTISVYDWLLVVQHVR